MPFILQERRKRINDGALGICGLQEIQPGDLCYVHYKKMVDTWKTNPRWTTAHEIYRDLKYNCEDINDFVAEQLAWQVFFQLYVMPYELKKRDENGDI